MGTQQEMVVTPSFLADVHVLQSDIAPSAGISRFEIMITTTQQGPDPEGSWLFYLVFL